MTSQKTFKRRVRSRMEKTGESYVTARRHLLEGEKHEVRDQAPADYRAPISDQAIRGSTGRDWSEWFATLDAWEGHQRDHRDIAAWLGREHGVDSWWAQGITVAYEQARGKRAPGQRADGTFAASASKTVAVSVERLSTPSPTRSCASGGSQVASCASARLGAPDRYAPTGTMAPPA